MRLLVTGGSGFIGTNLVETLLKENQELLSIDLHPPRIQSHRAFFRKADIRRPDELAQAIIEFAPTHVVHLAARADLDERENIEGYAANTDGVRNLIQALSQAPSARRCLFTSTKLIVPNASGPKNDLDFRPDTLYGQSKVMGEQIVREAGGLKFDWCIIRPTSIWGPWSDAPYNPYGRFFRTVAKGWYFHPGKADPPRYFGYVGNVVFQIQKILSAPTEAIQGKVFYLADYEIYHIRKWAELISRKTNGHSVKVLPMGLVRLLALGGDFLQHLGLKNPPMTSLRLRNMRTDTTGLPLEPTETLTGPLPYSIERGVEETIAWFREQKLINCSRS